MKYKTYVPELDVLCPALVEPEGDIYQSPGWFSRMVVFICLVTFMQLNLYSIKETYAGTITTTDLDVMGMAGERTMTNNNLAGTILRARGGKQGNQMFAFSNGAPQVWAVYENMAQKGKIVVETMYQHSFDSPSIKPGGGNKLKGDVELISLPINPSHMDDVFSVSNGIQTYLKGANPFQPFQYDRYIGEAMKSPATYPEDPCITGNSGCEFLLNNIDAGAFQALVALVARYYGTSHANIAMLQSKTTSWEESHDCGFLDLGEEKTYIAEATFTTQWVTMTASDNAPNRAYMAGYVSSAKNNGCMDTNELKALRVALNGEKDMEGNVISLPTRTTPLSVEESKMLEECAVRSAASFIQPGFANSMPGQETKYWHYQETGGCGLPFIVMLIIAVVLVLVLMYICPPCAAALVNTLGTIGGAAVAAVGATLPVGMAGLYLAVAIGAAAAYTAISVVAGGGFGSVQNADGLFGSAFFGSLGDGGQGNPYTEGEPKWDARIRPHGFVDCVLNAKNNNVPGPGDLTTGDIFGLKTFPKCSSVPIPANPLYDYYKARRLCDEGANYKAQTIDVSTGKITLTDDTSSGSTVPDCNKQFATAQDAYILKESAMVDNEGKPLSGFELPTAFGAKPKVHVDGDVVTPGGPEAPAN